MARKISLIYLTGNEQVVSGFARSLATGDECGAIGRDVQFRHGVTKMYDSAVAETLHFERSAERGGLRS